jgi:hypothetical protein
VQIAGALKKSGALPASLRKHEMKQADADHFEEHFRHFQEQTSRWNSYRQRRADRLQQQQQQHASSLAPANTKTHPHQHQQQQQYSSSCGNSQLMQQQQPQLSTTAQLPPTTTAASKASAAAATTTATTCSDTLMSSEDTVLYIGGSGMSSERATAATAINDNVAFLREKGISSVGSAVAAVKELRSASSSATAMSGSVRTSASATSTTVGKTRNSIEGAEMKGKVAAVIDSVITEAPAATVARGSSDSSSSVAPKRKSRWGMTPADMLISDAGMLPMIQPTADGVNSSMALSEVSSATHVSDKLAVSDAQQAASSSATVASNPVCLKDASNTTVEGKEQGPYCASTSSSSACIVGSSSVSIDDSGSTAAAATVTAARSSSGSNKKRNRWDVTIKSSATSSSCSDETAKQHDACASSDAAATATAAAVTTSNRTAAAACAEAANTDTDHSSSVHAQQLFIQQAVAVAVPQAKPAPLTAEQNQELKAEVLMGLTHEQFLLDMLYGIESSSVRTASCVNSQ